MTQQLSMKLTSDFFLSVSLHAAFLSSQNVFGVPALDFPGYRVDQHGIRPLPEKVQSITDFPPPITVRKLQEFLALVKFYRRLIPNGAKIVRPLADLLKGVKRH